MTTLVRFPTQVSKLIPRLASDHDGEVVATARAIDRTLKAAGADWHDVAAACERMRDERADGHETFWHHVAVWCRDCRARLSPQEFFFVRDMAARLVLGGQPSERQANWLRSIYAKLHPGEP